MNQRCDSDPPLPPGLDLCHRAVDGTLVIAAIGDVVTDTAPALSKAINACIDQAGGPCILDLSDVTFLGSAGLTALLHATRHSEARRQPLPIVVDANRPVSRPSEVTGVDNTLTLHHTVDEALEASKPPGGTFGSVEKFVIISDGGIPAGSTWQVSTSRNPSP